MVGDAELMEEERWTSVEVEGPDEAGVAALRLNRPARANAVGEALFRELPLALQRLDGDPAVRAIVLGANGRHFCAGIDLGSLSAGPSAGGPRALGSEREAFRRRVLAMQDAFSALERCRKPVLAAVHGACIGAGIDLITACDLRYCTADAKFSVKEVDLAITADLGTLQRLPSAVGYANAMELALTARTIDGREAARLGLVHGVVTSMEELEKKTREIATQIAGKAPLAIMGTKTVLLKSRDVSVADGLDYVATWNAALLWEDDIKESMAAKVEKRNPAFAKL